MIEAESKPRFYHIRLFTPFLFLGLVCLFLLALLLFQVWVRMFERHLIQEAKEIRANYIGMMVGTVASQEDFRGVKRGVEWKSFEEKMAPLLSLAEVARINIYNQAGDLIWSDSLDLLERPSPAQKKPGLLKALAGQVEAGISRLEKEEHRFERGTFRTLMELYVPISFGPKEKPVGVVEVYLNMDALSVTIRNIRWLFALTLVGGLGLFLFFPVAGSGRMIALINKQNEDLRKQEEMQKLLSAGLLEEMRKKSDFLNTMAHELKNPLNVVMATQQLFLDGFYGDLSEEQKRGLEPIGKNAYDLLNLINQILDLARLEAGKVPLHIEEFPLKETMDDLESSFIPLVREKGLELRFELEDPLPKIESDRSKIKEVLQNLLANAIKYTDRGEIELRVCCHADGPQRGRISFSIRDTGIGIRKEDIPRIFEPFHMTGEVDRKKYPGTGLGLSIVKRLVELLEGEIQVESEWGKGSTFTVTLPLVHPTKS